MKILIVLLSPIFLFCKTTLGIDRFFQEGYAEKYKNKRIGLVVNQASTNGKGISSLQCFMQNVKEFPLAVIFAPEHGIKASAYAAETIAHSQHAEGIKIFSLHGATRRPTKEILQELDVIIYDIQSIGTRSYTYETTLFYIMEEAAKYNVEVVLLDRPNPMGGKVVDGPLLDEENRSFIGYINIPYCHGMTIGELANFFNQEYHIGCLLTVIPMLGWKRGMIFKETGLVWIPPSPNIPESDTPFFYASTGILGELRALNIGIGYTLPFKIAGAPWIEADRFASHLNEQKIPGIIFYPFYFKPFFGAYKGEECEGVYIHITDPNQYRPLLVQYLILGMLKSLYPKEFHTYLHGSGRELFTKANGSKKILQILEKEAFPFWKLKQAVEEDIAKFLPIRKKYLLYESF